MSLTQLSVSTSNEIRPSVVHSDDDVTGHIGPKVGPDRAVLRPNQTVQPRWTDAAHHVTASESKEVAAKMSPVVRREQQFMRVSMSGLSGTRVTMRGAV